MAELSTLARPYAKAAFDYANEQGVVNDWENFLSVATAVVADESFREVLDNPSISAEQKSTALIGVYDDQAADLNHKATASIKNFITQLAQQERLALIPQIYEQYRLQREEALKEINAYITSAYALTSTQRELIKNRLEQSLNATVNVHESVDPSLVAGATIKIGDKVVDDSVKGKLKQLKTQLTT